MDDTLLRLAVVVASFCIASYIVNAKRIPRPPPGPPADPLIGHLRLLQTTTPESAFREWTKRYGDVVHLTCLGQSVIVLDSNKAAIDLLEKRGALYSDRPNITVYELMGWDPDVAFLPYGQRFRKHRKLMNSYFTQKACVQFQPIQLQNTHLLISGLMENKGNFDYLLSRFSTAVIMRIAYGHQIVSDDDEYIQIANDSGEALHHGGIPGGTLVDLFPILQHFPSWFPGTHYANVAREWRWAIRKLYDLPYESVLKQMDKGTAEPSFLSTHLEATADRSITQEDIEDLKGAAGTIYGAGAETTWSSLTTFFLAMLLYPESQKLGQEEIDRVIGRDRLPSFEDLDSLPYIGCVVQEILRWNPVVPLGIPHSSTHDDIYRGMLIPKGSYMFANAKGMSLDENVYASPTVFNPSRFLPKSQGGNEEPLFEAAFGFGRRICPGRHLAIANIWIAVATIFSTINISKAKDEKGAEIIPSVEFVSGLTSHPKPFPCNISARSTKTNKLIQDAVTDIVNHVK